MKIKRNVFGTGLVFIMCLFFMLFSFKAYAKDEPVEDNTTDIEEDLDKKSAKLLDDLLTEIEEMIGVDLIDYRKIKFLLDKSNELTSEDKLIFDERVEPFVNEYINYVKSINKEFEEAKNVETKFSFTALNIMSSITILGYSIFMKKRWL